MRPTFALIGAAPVTPGRIGACAARLVNMLTTTSNGEPAGWSVGWAGALIVRRRARPVRRGRRVDVERATWAPGPAQPRGSTIDGAGAQRAGERAQPTGGGGSDNSPAEQPAPPGRGEA